MRAVEVFRARGHPNVRAEHSTTLEITRDDYLTPRGDCIVAVCSEKAASDLSGEFKRLARRSDCVVTLTLLVDGLEDRVVGRGSPGLTFTDPRSMVFRRSGYTCPRTVMVGADKAARDLDRELVRALRDGREVLVVLEAYLPGPEE